MLPLIYVSQQRLAYSSGITINGIETQQTRNEVNKKEEIGRRFEGIDSGNGCTWGKNDDNDEVNTNNTEKMKL